MSKTRHQFIERLSQKIAGRCRELDKEAEACGNRFLKRELLAERTGLRAAFDLMCEVNHELIDEERG